MENFEFYNPCRILFGDGKLDIVNEAEIDIVIKAVDEAMTKLGW